jgi:hypothetical protein
MVTIPKKEEAPLIKQLQSLFFFFGSMIRLIQIRYKTQGL